MLLLETIRLTNGKAERINLHVKRMAQSLGTQQTTAILPDIATCCPLELRSGITKCRVVYSKEGVSGISFSPYRSRKISSLKLVELPQRLDYSLKYLDRSALDALKAGIEADELLLVRDGLLTDTTYSNIVCLGHDQVWYTPKKPLLAGTRRADLVASKSVIERDIFVRDLEHYKSVGLINAMLPLGEIVIPCEAILK